MIKKVKVDSYMAKMRYCLSSIKKANKFIEKQRNKVFINIFLIFQVEKKAKQKTFVDNSYFQYQQKYGKEKFSARKNFDFDLEKNYINYAKYCI